MNIRRSILILLTLWTFAGIGSSATVLQTNEVICVIGGANAVAGQECGYLESFLRIGFPAHQLRLRSLAHEGDTVYAQPRDFNYPALAQQVHDARATLVLLYFGQTEALDGREKLQRFLAAYENFNRAIVGPRLVLISPFPYEASKPPLPNISAKNVAMREYVAGIRDLANKNNWSYIDLFTYARRNYSFGNFTSDGLHLNQIGHWYYDWLVATDLGVKLLQADFFIEPSSGAFKRAEWERVRQVVLRKDNLWFSYYRPTNWAFLGGDRTDQPSSRDYQNPKIRWFPDEMQRFLPLIEQCETEISMLSQQPRRPQ